MIENRKLVHFLILFLKKKKRIKIFRISNSILKRKMNYTFDTQIRNTDDAMTWWCEVWAKRWLPCKGGGLPKMKSTLSALARPKFSQNISF